MVAGQLLELAGVLRAGLQYPEQPLALVDLVAVEAHQQVAGLAVGEGHLLEGLLRRGAELTAEVELLAQLRQQGDGALGREIVEAQGHQGAGSPAAIRCQ